MATYGKEIHNLIKAVDILRGDSADFPAQQLLTYLAVARQPGITMAALSEAVGMSQASTSRNVSALSKWHRLGHPGFDLVEAVEDPRERRRKIMYLTAKGRQRMAKALEALTGKPADDFSSPSVKDGLNSISSAVR